MNHKNIRTSQAGFSLVELMVVVAIIGVLAAIAVPQVNKYIAKARQSEAKTILSSVYTSEKAFYAEYSAYHAQFGAIGYSPEGKLRYNAGFSGQTNAGAAQGYTATLTGSATSITTATYCGSNGTISNGCTVLAGASGSAPAGVTTAVLNLTSFNARATAVVYGTTADVWNITNEKVLTNVTNGIN